MPNSMPVNAVLAATFSKKARTERYFCATGEELTDEFKRYTDIYSRRIKSTTSNRELSGDELSNAKASPEAVSAIIARADAVNVDIKHVLDNFPNIAFRKGHKAVGKDISTTNLFTYDNIYKAETKEVVKTNFCKIGQITDNISGPIILTEDFIKKNPAFKYINLARVPHPEDPDNPKKSGQQDYYLEFTFKIGNEAVLARREEKPLGFDFPRHTVTSNVLRSYAPLKSFTFREIVSNGEGKKDSYIPIATNISEDGLGYLYPFKSFLERYPQYRNIDVERVEDKDNIDRRNRYALVFKQRETPVEKGIEDSREALLDYINRHRPELLKNKVTVGNSANRSNKIKDIEEDQQTLVDEYMSLSQEQLEALPSKRYRILYDAYINYLKVKSNNEQALENNVQVHTAEHYELSLRLHKATRAANLAEYAANDAKRNYELLKDNELIPADEQEYARLRYEKAQQKFEEARKQAEELRALTKGLLKPRKSQSAAAKAMSEQEIAKLNAEHAEITAEQAAAAYAQYMQEQEANPSIFPSLPPLKAEDAANDQSVAAVAVAEDQATAEGLSSQASAQGSGAQGVASHSSAAGSSSSGSGAQASAGQASAAGSSSSGQGAQAASGSTSGKATKAKAARATSSKGLSTNEAAYAALFGNAAPVDEAAASANGSYAGETDNFDDSSDAYSADGAFNDSGVALDESAGYEGGASQGRGSSSQGASSSMGSSAHGSSAQGMGYSSQGSSSSMGSSAQGMAYDGEGAEDSSLMGSSEASFGASAGSGASSRSGASASVYSTRRRDPNVRNAAAVTAASDLTEYDEEGISPDIFAFALEQSKNKGRRAKEEADDEIIKITVADPLEAVASFDFKRFEGFEELVEAINKARNGKGVDGLITFMMRDVAALSFEKSGLLGALQAVFNNHQDAVYDIAAMEGSGVLTSTETDILFSARDATKVLIDTALSSLLKLGSELNKALIPALKDETVYEAYKIVEQASIAQNSPHCIKGGYVLELYGSNLPYAVQAAQYNELGIGRTAALRDSAHGKFLAFFDTNFKLLRLRENLHYAKFEADYEDMWADEPNTNLVCVEPREYDSYLANLTKQLYISRVNPFSLGEHINEAYAFLQELAKNHPTNNTYVEAVVEPQHYEFTNNGKPLHLYMVRDVNYTREQMGFFHGLTAYLRNLSLSPNFKLEDVDALYRDHIANYGELTSLGEGFYSFKYDSAKVEKMRLFTGCKFYLTNRTDLNGQYIEAIMSYAKPTSDFLGGELNRMLALSKDLPINRLHHSMAACALITQMHLQMRTYLFELLSRLGSNDEQTNLRYLSLLNDVCKKNSATDINDANTRNYIAILANAFGYVKPKVVEQPKGKKAKKSK